MEIDAQTKLSDIIAEYPFMRAGMAEINGRFRMLQTPMGKIMMQKATVSDMSARSGMPVDELVAAIAEKTGATFEAAGAGADPLTIGNGVEEEAVAGNVETGSRLTSADERQALLEQLVRRLSDGEDLESVRADFVRDFSSVSASEIAQAEQNLISSGMPVREVQQLCDVHSALFHGRTDAECSALAEADGLPAGHPAQVLKRENDALVALLDDAEAAIAGDADVGRVKELLAGLRLIRDHYAKKEQLLMPLLHAYGITGPMDVMWGVDDEIVHELSAIARELTEGSYPQLFGRIDAVLKRMREMVYKEEQIFLPLCRDHLTQEEWFAVHRDLDEYKPAFAESPQRWIDADVWAREKELEAKEAFSEGKVWLSTGALSVAQLEAVLKLLPLDLTFIDDGETTRFFTREGKVFARPLSCLDREVWLCHPPEIIPMIKNMIADFKSGARESMEVWNPQPGNPVRVVYVPVWGEQREYLGTLEIVQQFGELLPKLKELIG